MSAGARHARHGKEEARRRGLAARAALTVPERHDAALRLAQGFADHPLLRGKAPRNILVPSHHRDEIDTGPLAAFLDAAGWTIHRPRTIPDHTTIEAVAWPAKNRLVAGYAGIPEPPPDADATDARVMDVIAVPGAAFADDGARVGTGWGYFDRFLEPLMAQRAPPLIIGIGFRCQRIDGIPSEPHDVPMDGIQLEDESVVCRPRRPT